MNIHDIPFMDKYFLTGYLIKMSIEHRTFEQSNFDFNFEWRAGDAITFFAKASQVKNRVSTPNITWLLSFESWFLSLVSLTQVHQRDASALCFLSLSIAI
jgi:hypothetical protein